MIHKHLLQEYTRFSVYAKSSEIEKQEIEMFELVKAWKPFYQCIWSKLEDDEQLAVVNLAREGLVNYRQVDAITSLIKEGLIVSLDGRLRLFSLGFRNFILHKLATPETAPLREKMNKKASMSKLRTPILVALFLIGMFLFITQEQTFQRISGMITGLTTLIPLLFKFFTQQQESKN